MNIIMNKPIHAHNTPRCVFDGSYYNPISNGVWAQSFCMQESSVDRERATESRDSVGSMDEAWTSKYMEHTGEYWPREAISS